MGNGGWIVTKTVEWRTEMTPTNAPRRWLMIACVALGATLIAAGCGGTTASVTPSVASTAVAAPSVAPSPSPSPVDVGAAFLTTMSDTSFSSAADISGTMSVGPITGDITGDAAFSGGDSSMTMAIDLDVLKQETEQVQVGDQRWSRKSPGPWLEDPKAPAGTTGSSLGKILQSLVKVTDLGVVTKAGASLHHLQIPGTSAISGSLLGIDPTTTKDATFTLDFYATDAGVPAIMSLSGSWTQLSGEAELPASMTLDIAFTDVGKPQTISPPTDVWVVYTSKELGYSMAHPADWTVTAAKGEDTYSIGGQGYVYVATSPYKGSTAKFAADLKASYKKPFKGDPTSEKPTRLGGVAAVRLIYGFTNDSAQAVTVVDDVVSRDGTGWEVYLATAGGQDDIDIFDQFVATFTFAE